MTSLGHEDIGRELAEEARDDALPPNLRYGLEDRPKPFAALMFGLQHVLIMFTGTIVAPLIIGQMLNLAPGPRGALLTGVLLGAGAGTIVSSLGLSGIGARLPLMLGAYTVYVGPVTAIAKADSLGAAVGAMLAGGLILFVASPVLGSLRRLFPPVVVGTLLVVTGLTIMKIMVSVALGVNTPYLGNPLTFYFLIGSVMLVVILNAMLRGMAKALSVLLAMLCVYIVAIVIGIADFQPVAAAPWFKPPPILPLGIAWPDASEVSIVLIYCLVAAIYTMSITLALGPMVGAPPDDRGWRVRGAIAADGLGSVVAVLFGGVPLISYDQNVGAISLTGVGSRFVTAIAGALLVVMAFFPTLGAAIRVVPFFVFGGTLIFMFGMIAIVGFRILAGSIRSSRDGLILAAALGLSASVNYAPPQVFTALPQMIRILVSDGIVVGTLAAVILNLILPKESSP